MNTRLLLLSATVVLGIACQRQATNDDPGSDTDQDDVVEETTASDTDSTTDDTTDSEPNSDTETDDGEDPEPDGRASWCGPLDDPSLASATPTGVDADLAEVIALVPETGGEYAAIEVTVEGAIVTALGYPATRSFWVGDDDAGILLYLSDEVEEPSVGDAVSFTALEVTSYYGEREITEISGFTIDSSGNSFYVPTLYGEVLTYDEHVGRVGYLYGELTGDSDPELCWGDGYACMTYEHGGQVLNFRVKEDILTVGDWVEFCGPITGNNNEPTINASDWDWFQTY